MKKFLLILLGTVVLLAGGVYVLLFTPPGNALLAPVVESKINEAAGLQSRLERFSLTPGSFALTLAITPENRVEAEGTYGLLSHALNADYRVRFERLEALKALTEQNLTGVLHVDGTASGSFEQLKVDGTSDVAQSRTAFETLIENGAAQRLEATVSGARSESLLAMLGQLPAVSGALDLDVRLDDLNPEALKGNVTLKLSEGSVDKALLERRFGLRLAKSAFRADGEARLDAGSIAYRIDVASDLANIRSNGTVVPERLAADLTYDLSLKELGMLESVTPIPMRGAIAAKGSVKGDRAKMVVDGTSDLAGSDTSYRVTLENLEARSVTAKVRGAGVGKLLSMLDRPRYGDGTIDLDVNLPDARMGSLDGTVKSSVRNGTVDEALVSKTFDLLPMPETRFSTQSETALKGNTATTRSNIRSTLANVTGKSAVVRLDTGHVTADFDVELPNLDALYFVTERHLKGALRVTGDVSVAKDLDLNARSETLGGTLTATLHNDDLKASVAAVRTMDALKMLIYPEIFDATMDGTLDYNLKTKKGNFNSDLKKGIFVRNVMLDLVKQGTGMNLYKERFDGTLSGALEKARIVADLDLKANTSSIGGKKMIIESEKRLIAAKLDIVANRNPVGVTLKGPIDAPKVTLDLSDLAEKEAKKALQKEAGKLFDKLF